MKRIKLVVIDNHTLACIFPDSKSADILHASVLRGAVCASQAIEPTYYEGRDVKLASEKDFDDFRVSFKGFEDEKVYEFQK